jgi:hypothetical protein
MPAAPKSQSGRSKESTHLENVIGSAAGAIMRADNVSLMLDASDAEVGRLLKEEVRRLRSELRLVAGSGKDIVVGRTHEVKLDLPPKQHFPAIGISDVDVLAEVQTNRRKLVAAGELLTSAGLRGALLMSRQAVSFATREKRLFKVAVDGREYYPAFFACPQVNRRVLESISKGLGPLPGWLKWGFFTMRRDSLGGVTALKALSRGKEELVREVAKRFLEEEIA